MIFIAVLKATGQTVAQGNTAMEAYTLATQAGYSPADIQVVPIGGGPRA